MAKKIAYFEYDFTPTEDKEVVLFFKVDGINCEMKISQRDLERMVWITKQVDIR